MTDRPSLSNHKNWLFWIFPSILFCVIGFFGFAYLAETFDWPVLSFALLAVFLLVMLVAFTMVVWLSWKDLLDFRNMGWWRDLSFRFFARWFSFVVGLLGAGFTLFGLIMTLRKVLNLIVE